MRLLSKFFALLKRFLKKVFTMSDAQAQAAAPVGDQSDAAGQAAGAAQQQPAAAPAAPAAPVGVVQSVINAVVDSTRASERLKLGIRLAAHLSTLAPGATEDQVEAAATAALDVLLPSVLE